MTDLVSATFHGNAIQVPPGTAGYPLYFDDEAGIREEHWNIEPGDFVIDVGARYGQWTIPALACGARVLAIDSNAALFPATLRSITQMNDGFDERLETRVVALFDGTSYPPELAAQVAPDEHPLDHGAPWSTLDEVVGRRKVDWIKVDVEGAELGVLSGAAAILRKYHPKIIVEDHTQIYDWVAQNDIRKHCLDLLVDSFGYHVESVPWVYTDGTGGRDYMVAT